MRDEERNLVARYERYRELGPPPEAFSLAAYETRGRIEARMNELLAAGCYPGYESSAMGPLELAKRHFGSEWKVGRVRLCRPDRTRPHSS